MSYYARLLFEKISASLHDNPCMSLRELSQNLHISERTIQKTVRSACGRSFRCVREEILLARVRWLFSAQPDMAIKEISFGVGFQSASSFGRAVKRASGSSPKALRSQVAEQH